jgi:hypothetical protein
MIRNYYGQSVAYFTVMLGSALSIKYPHPSYVPPGSSDGMMEENKSASTPNVSTAEAIRSPQFHLLGITLTCLATGGMGILTVAKPMMSEVCSCLLYSFESYHY